MWQSRSIHILWRRHVQEGMPPLLCVVLSLSLSLEEARRRGGHSLHSFRADYVAGREVSCLNDASLPWCCCLNGVLRLTQLIQGGAMGVSDNMAGAYSCEFCARLVDTWSQFKGLASFPCGSHDRGHLLLPWNRQKLRPQSGIDNRELNML